MIVLGFFSLIAAAFAVYSAATTANYRQLRTAEVSKTVAFEAERVGKEIVQMERNAIDLALAGYQYYLSGEHSVDLGASISIENFTAFENAVGGGIWFEPFALDRDMRRVCYYAFYDPSIDAVRYDPEFESEEYDYHSQMWYTEIAARTSGKNSVAWTAPYFETIGTHSLMTTVGAGIYDETGRFIGMSTVDWQIQAMVDSLSAIKPTENSFVLLASPRDDYVISNTFLSGVDYVGSSLSNLPWHKELQYTGYSNVGISSFTQDGVDYISFSRLFNNGWLFSVQIPSREIFVDIETRNERFSLIIGISSLVLLGLAFILVSGFINRPLRLLMSGVIDLGGGNLDRQIKIHSKDEFGVLATMFNKMTVDLKESIEQNARERAEKERIGAELNVAKTIQANMLPSIFPPFPDKNEFDLYASMVPAKEVGGDFYDFFLIDNDHLGMVIADVSGKSVPAALFMVIAKTLINNRARENEAPQDVFTNVNNQLCEGNETAMFVTAWFAVLEISTGNLTYVNAGHNPPLLKKADKTFEYLKTKKGFVLAGMENFQYKQLELTLSKGDTLFLYTDGVTEANNPSDELYGEKRLQNTLNACIDLTPAELLLRVKEDIDKFTEGAPQFDDITMLAIKIN